MIPCFKTAQPTAQQQQQHIVLLQYINHPSKNKWWWHQGKTGVIITWAGILLEIVDILCIRLGTYPIFVLLFCSFVLIWFLISYGTVYSYLVCFDRICLPLYSLFFCFPLFLSLLLFVHCLFCWVVVVCVCVLLLVCSCVVHVDTSR